MGDTTSGGSAPIDVIGPQTAALWATSPPPPGTPDYASYAAWKAAQPAPGLPMTAAGASGPVGLPRTVPFSVEPGPGRTVPFSQEPPDPATGEAAYGPLVDAAADHYNIPRDIARGLVAQESNWNPTAKGQNKDGSYSGAMGLTQLTHGTAQDLKVDPTDPTQNIVGGMAYLRQMLDKFGGDMPSALQAYNAGPNDPSQWNPGYAQKVYAKAGREAPDITPPEAWGPVANTLNALSLGLGKRATALSQAFASQSEDQAPGEVVPPTAGSTYAKVLGQENAAQTEYGAKAPWESLATESAGALLPDIAAAKGLKLAGEAMAENLPAGVSSKLYSLLGSTPEAGAATPGTIAQIAAQGKALPLTLARGVASGASTGALNSQIGNGDTSVGGQMLMGAAFGTGGALLGQGGGLVQAGLQPFYDRFLRGDNSWMGLAQNRLASLMGGTALTPAASAIPGVQRTLPEMLMAGNPQGEALENAGNLTGLLAQVGGHSAKLAAQQEGNNAARSDFLDRIVGTPQDIAQKQSEIDTLNGTMTPLLKQATAPLDLEPARAGLVREMANPESNKIPGHNSTLREVHDLLFQPKKSGPEAKGVMSLEDLKNSPSVEDQLEKAMQEAQNPAAQPLHTSPAEVHGIRAAVQRHLDMLDNPMSPGDTKTKRALVGVKDLLEDQLRDKVPGYGDFLDKYSALAEQRDKLKFLQSHTFKSQTGELLPNAIRTTLKQVEQAPWRRGVLGPRARAKAVDDGTVGALQTLLDDLTVAKRAGVSLAVPEHVLNAGTHRATVGHSFWPYIMGGGFGYDAGEHLIPGGGYAGAAAGVALQAAHRMVEQANARKLDGLTLRAMLNPTQYPPKALAPPGLPSGVLSGLLGASQAGQFGQTALAGSLLK